MSTLFSQENILFFDLFFSPHECEFAAYIVRIYARKMSISKNGHEIRSPSHPLNVWNWPDMALQKPKASLSIFSYYKRQVYQLFFILHALPIESISPWSHPPNRAICLFNSDASYYIVFALRSSFINSIITFGTSSDYCMADYGPLPIYPLSPADCYRSVHWKKFHICQKTRKKQCLREYE